MARADYHVYGLGSGADDLRYVGWTQRSLSDEQEQIFSDLLRSSGRDIASWVEDAIERGKISIFEIESHPSVEDARNAAISLCRYFRSLGLDVITAGVEEALTQDEPCHRPGWHAEGSLGRKRSAYTTIGVRPPSIVIRAPMT
jgi:hypothetical protein